MKILFQSVLIILFVSLSAQSYNQNEPKVEDYRNLSMKFMGELKSILQKEIKQNGIVNAVSVCSDTAQTLTQQFAKEHNIYIKRVSAKNRNPINIPNDYESSAIQKLEKLKSEGNLKKETEFFEIVNSNGIKTVNYIKPIVTEGICLSCHGSESTISDDVKQILSNKYPEDKAVGYSIGDLRGIISISKEIK
ncbi:MAG: hypothetical protein CMF23_01185 [Ignavibacteriae bacterium]|nr:hypothetical protein [Ignavibacteriota bacterium]